MWPQGTEHLVNGENKGIILSLPAWLLLDLPQDRGWPRQFAYTPWNPAPRFKPGLHGFSPPSLPGEICIGWVWLSHKWNWLFRCFGLKGICFHSSSFFCLLLLLLGSKTPGLLRDRDRRLWELLQAHKQQRQSRGARVRWLCKLRICMWSQFRIPGKAVYFRKAF